MNTRHFARAVATAGTVAAITAVVLAARAIRPRRYRIYYMPVRDAGPDCMGDPPDEWDHTDQAVDESFPASDPPTHSRFT
jgi:hypothetical protein